MEYKTKEVDGIEVCFASDWINDIESEIHFRWYYHQAKLVYDKCTREDSIIEIGVGTGLLSDLLKRRNWKIKTLDIDEDKNPDICESASEFDYSSVDTNVVLAFEVFEHIPFTTFEKVVEKISKSLVKKIYFSLPWNEYRLIDFKLEMPVIKNISFRIPISRRKIDTKAHFWELSGSEKQLGEKRLIKVESIAELFKKYGFTMSSLNKVGYIQYFQAIRSI